MIVPEEKKDILLDTLHKNKYGKGAAVIGRITSDHQGYVVSNTQLGVKTILPQPGNELLPRIC